jgi:hypothetical protein
MGKLDMDAMQKLIEHPGRNAGKAAGHVHGADAAGN